MFHLYYVFSHRQRLPDTQIPVLEHMSLSMFILWKAVLDSIIILLIFNFQHVLHLTNFQSKAKWNLLYSQLHVFEI